MIPKRRTATHPGEVLLEEFLKPLGMRQTQVAKKLGMPLNRINEIVRGKRGVTADTAWKLAYLFRCSPEFWMNLQTQYDLSRTRPSRIRAA